MSHDELKEYLADRFGGYALFEPESFDDGIVGSRMKAMSSTRMRSWPKR